MMRITSTTRATALAACHAEAMTCGEVWDACAFASLLQNGAHALIATDNDNPSKPAGLLISRNSADECEILTLSILPYYRNKSLASQLLMQLEETLAEQQVTRLFLEVRADNLPAQKLYQKHGFEVIATRPNYYRTNKGKIDAVVMQKRLSAK